MHVLRVLSRGGNYNGFDFDSNGLCKEKFEKQKWHLFFICFEARRFRYDFKNNFVLVNGQLQRFYKLISNDRIWPSEHGFEVIFEKSLFVFEVSAFKVRNKRGIHSRFYSFSENINLETFVCEVTSDQSSMISTERSDLRDCKASGSCYV